MPFLLRKWCCASMAGKGFNFQADVGLCVKSPLCTFDETGHLDQQYCWFWVRIGKFSGFSASPFQQWRCRRKGEKCRFVSSTASIWKKETRITFFIRWGSITVIAMNIFCFGKASKKWRFTVRLTIRVDPPTTEPNTSFLSAVCGYNKLVQLFLLL